MLPCCHARSHGEEHAMPCHRVYPTQPVPDAGLSQVYSGPREIFGSGKACQASKPSSSALSSKAKVSTLSSDKLDRQERRPCPRWIRRLGDQDPHKTAEWRGI